MTGEIIWRCISCGYNGPDRCRTCRLRWIDRTPLRKRDLLPLAYALLLLAFSVAAIVYEATR